MKKSRVYAVTLSSILALCGCAKDVDCSVNSDHIHYYKTNSGIIRLIAGEKEYRGEFQRLDNYVLLDSTYQIITDNHLCILKDNLEYVETKFENRPDISRYEMVSELIPEHYGLYYESKSDGEIGNISYGLVPEKYETSWQEIEPNVYTDNPVKDVSYGILLYRINEDGTLESKVFRSLEEVEEGYDYFKTGTLITKIESEEYYLDKGTMKKKSY